MEMTRQQALTLDENFELSVSGQAAHYLQLVSAIKDTDFYRIDSCESTVPSARDSNTLQTGRCDACGRHHRKVEGRDTHFTPSSDIQPSVIRPNGSFFYWVCLHQGLRCGAPLQLEQWISAHMLASTSASWGARSACTHNNGQGARDDSQG